MDHNSIAIDEAFLRLRMRRFLTSRSIRRSPLIDALRQIREKWSAYFFGGAPRDMLISPKGRRPRDLDIVVDVQSIDEIASCLQQFVTRRTRFGGLHLDVAGWPVDIWPIEQTWALRQFPDRFRSVADLPRTTFFNVEAVLVELTPTGTRGRTIHSLGFFDALRTRVLELNFAENPFPALCVIRSLYLAAKLQFAIGPRLARFLVDQMRVVTLQDVMDAQQAHYGACRLFGDEVANLWDSVAQANSLHPSRPVVLPISHSRQLLLWDTLTATSSS